MVRVGCQRRASCNRGKGDCWTFKRSRQHPQKGGGHPQIKWAQTTGGGETSDTIEATHKTPYFLVFPAVSITETFAGVRIRPPVALEHNLLRVIWDTSRSTAALRPSHQSRRWARCVTRRSDRLSQALEYALRFVAALLYIGPRARRGRPRFEISWERTGHGFQQTSPVRVLSETYLR